MCVIRHLEIVQVGSSVVPVHHYDVGVCPGQQQLHSLIQPPRDGPCGPVPVNDEGGGSGQVELGVEQVGVGQERAAGCILPGEQPELHLHAGANERVADIELCQFVTYVSRWGTEREQKRDLFK